MYNNGIDNRNENDIDKNDKSYIDKKTSIIINIAMKLIMLMIS